MQKYSDPVHMYSPGDDSERRQNQAERFPQRYPTPGAESAGLILWHSSLWDSTAGKHDVARRVLSSASCSAARTTPPPLDDPSQDLSSAHSSICSLPDQHLSFMTLALKVAKPANETTPPPDIRWHAESDVGTNPSEYVANLQQPDDFASERGDTSGVTIKPAPHLANGFSALTNKSQTTDDILTELLQNDDTRAQLIQTSFEGGKADPTFYPNSHSFVNAAINAYNQHRHLQIRPEDVWLAILTQLSSYINAHAEELRGFFVAHDGKKELRIEYHGGTRFTISWADFAYKIGTMIQDHVVDPELREWMMPAFSTTTSHDVVVSSIVMMASMQKYFSYTCSITCGLPSVTLLGRKADYELILRRIDKLRSYGPEPSLFADLLTPVLKRFIRSFEAPNDPEVLDFWNRIFSRYDMGSGSDEWSGWITAFLFWNEEGKILYSDRRRSWIDENLPPLKLDGIMYHTISEDDVPPGFCAVPVHIINNGEEIAAETLAGSIGWDWSSSGGEVAVLQPAPGSTSEAPSKDHILDTIRPRTGWWIYEKLPDAVVKANREAKQKEQTEEFEKWKAEL